MKAIEVSSESSSTGNYCTYCDWDNHCVQEYSFKARHEKEVVASRSRAEASKKIRRGILRRAKKDNERWLLSKWSSLPPSNDSAFPARLSYPSSCSIFLLPDGQRLKRSSRFRHGGTIHLTLLHFCLVYGRMWFYYYFLNRREWCFFIYLRSFIYLQFNKNTFWVAKRAQ